MKKVSLLVIMFLLMMQAFPLQTFAEQDNESDGSGEVIELALVHQNNEDSTPPLYENNTSEANEIEYEFNGAFWVKVLEKGQDQTLITFPVTRTSPENAEWKTGWISNEFLLSEDETALQTAEENSNPLINKDTLISLEANKADFIEFLKLYEEQLQEEAETEIIAEDTEQAEESLTSDPSIHNEEAPGAEETAAEDVETAVEVLDPAVDETEVEEQDPAVDEAEVENNDQDTETDKETMIEKESTEEDKVLDEENAEVSAQSSMMSMSAVTSIKEEPVIKGTALKNKTHVYVATERGEILKSYSEGSTLQFKSHSDNWYKATVYLSGQAHTGYIHADDVLLEGEEENQTSRTVATEHPVIKGIALKSPTNVYAATDRGTVLKSYSEGSTLQFRYYSDSWYSANVYIGGEAHAGFIHADDIDLLSDTSESLRGYGLKDPTNVYSGTDQNGSVLKSYPAGSSLQYRSYSGNWYAATVYVGGKARTGYIHANDVGDKPPLISGIALKSPTAVYSERSTSSSALKTYSKGSILKYRYYNANWYEATVYVNGSAHTGYIHSNDVERYTQSPVPLTGVGVMSPTNVYSEASTGSGVLKSYAAGQVLQYETFTSDWYRATVYVNGGPTTGYIHADHVENAIAKQKRIVGAAYKSSTNVYASASKSSGVLKSYSYGSRLIYRTFTGSWFQATVYVDGRATTGYVHKDDVRSFEGRTIVLDAGHGGKDSGAIAGGMLEKELVLDISLRSQRILENAGANVIMTRTTDRFLELHERAAIANNSGGELFLSVHANAFNGLARGTETFWYSRYEAANSQRLALNVQDAVIDKIGTSYRRVAEGNYHVVRETKIPSALLEVGFMDNPDDAVKLRSSYYRQLTAEGVFEGLLQYFSLD
ncbi:N-acetylmuramoyl-L-alanine amidase [Jeotgalibacillus haloalkalitolerans]|uniref:N-acetylmuramoyl-L-alanine amidase n=1 Tax=Jeotgalibacillus haloalkalitolerans TaxID=3104292 RepID=A0ABU5KJ57_9BACL|nr:N-acetylmuramoyl-L-alanine amidase [Jeotgalibacillus sp. HH7-29]MDZ5711292.1 N-acetylmuramoyl-L-alanine amidase [Jeotgalibacillus sp. HH7-29]